LAACGLRSALLGAVADLTVFVSCCTGTRVTALSSSFVNFLLPAFWLIGLETGSALVVTLTVARLSVVRKNCLHLLSGLIACTLFMNYTILCKGAGLLKDCWSLYMCNKFCTVLCSAPIVYVFVNSNGPGSWFEDNLPENLAGA
jgi:hypothetical protein